MKTINENVPKLLGKPVLTHNSRVLNLDSGFKHKLLCTGPTFTAGSACAYRCSYCYVEQLLGTKPLITNLTRGLAFKDVVIRRAEPIAKLKAELRDAKERLKYKGATGVIFGSPLVDIAANGELVEETIQLVRVLLDDTGWDIRLLTKSPLVKKIAESLNPGEKNRVIFGLSTGCLDDGLARATEPTCPPPSKRTAALRWLQDNGFRTFGMLCPLLPQDLSAFLDKVQSDIRPERCEHVWAEVINLRGNSMTATVASLVNAGYEQAAAELAAVSGAENAAAWEAYARCTFTALAEKIPHNETEPKLRFLQYVTKATQDWWSEQVPNGAVVLGKVASASAGATVSKTKSPARVAAAKKAWETIRAKQAAM